MSVSASVTGERLCDTSMLLNEVFLEKEKWSPLLENLRPPKTNRAGERVTLIVINPINDPCWSLLITVDHCWNALRKLKLFVYAEWRSRMHHQSSLIANRQEKELEHQTCSCAHCLLMGRCPCPLQPHNPPKPAMRKLYVKHFFICKKLPPS